MIRWKTERTDTNKSKRGVEPFKRKKNYYKEKKTKKKTEFWSAPPIEKNNCLHLSKFISNWLHKFGIVSKENVLPHQKYPPTHR